MKSISTTLVSAVVNVLPAFTFIMAVIFRLETVNIRQIHSVAEADGEIHLIYPNVIGHIKDPKKETPINIHVTLC